MAALLEGLDYLACFTCESNFARIQEEFDVLPLTRCPPAGFEGVRPHFSARHEVIVLADSTYYEFHSRRSLSQHWDLLNSLRLCDCQVKLSLAVASINDDGIYCSDQIRWCNSQEY
jgi:hypothetical protein